LDRYNEKHNFKQNEVQEFVIEKLAAFPTGALLGRIIDHTGLGNLYKCIDASGDTTQPEKWRAVGSASIILNFSRNHKRLKSQWLRLGNGEIVSNVVGHKIWFNGLIKNIVVNTNSATDAVFYIYKKTDTGFDSELCNIYLNGDYHKKQEYSVSVAEDDEIACFMDVVSGRVHFPEVKVILISF
jgi:hypothetical protein